MTKDLIKLLVRISKLNILIIYPLQGEVDSILYKVIGRDFKRLSSRELEERISAILLETRE